MPATPRTDHDATSDAEARARAPERQGIGAGMSEHTSAGDPAFFTNPYTFVRALPEPASPPTSLLWRAPPPPHDRWVGLSGHVVCRLTTVTPVFVADSHAVSRTQVRGKEDGAHHTYRFFRGPGDAPSIPSTSLRGMIRGVHEAATNACLIHVADGRVSYSVGPKRRETLPRSIHEMIPAHLHGCAAIDRLCPSCRLFGWVAPEERSRVAYRGRVRFSDAVFGERDLRKVGATPLRVLGYKH